MRAEKRIVNTEVYRWIPIGKRYFDLDVWHSGDNLGGVETKVGGSRHLLLQSLKDSWPGSSKNVELLFQ